MAPLTAAPRRVAKPAINLNGPYYCEFAEKNPYRDYTKTKWYRPAQVGGVWKYVPARRGSGFNLDIRNGTYAISGHNGPGFIVGYDFAGNSIASLPLRGPVRVGSFLRRETQEGWNRDFYSVIMASGGMPAEVDGYGSYPGNIELLVAKLSASEFVYATCTDASNPD